jgi:hypothetical protein
LKPGITFMIFSRKFWPARALSRIGSMSPRFAPGRKAGADG